MILRFNKSKKVILLTFLISGFLFAAQAQAVAPLAVFLIPLLKGAALTALGGTILWGIGAAVKGVTYLAFLTGAVFFIGKVAALFGKIIDNLASFPNFILDLQIVVDVWKIARDFVNLFFILILIVIAFATIFNKPQGYRASELLPKLIIAALLINFSLVITQTVIELLYIPTPVFLNALGGADFTGKIADALKLKEFLSFRGLSSAALSNSLQQYLTVGGLIYILAGIVANIVLIWIGLILLIRLPMLIGLAVVSPITWLAFSFPKMQSFWDDWWCKLLYWSLIPAFLFGVVYFSLLINKSLEFAQIPRVPLPLIGVNLDQFIILFATATLLIGGLWWVNGFLSKTACLTGYNLANATFGKARGWFWGVTGWTAGRAAGGAQTLYKTRSGVPGGIETTRQRLAEEGVILGTRARETREARVADRLARWAGLRPTYATQRITEEQSEKAKRDIESELKQAMSTTEENVIIEKLRTTVEERAKKGAKDPETLAAVKVLAKKGQLDVDLFKKAVENFKDMPLTLTSVLNEWKEGKFGGITVEQFLEVMRDKDNKLNLDARRTMYSFAASDDGKKTAEKFEYKDFDTGEQVLGRNTKAGRDYFKFWGDSNPVYVSKYRFDNRTDRIKSGYDEKDLERIQSLQDAIIEQTKRASVKNVADYFYNTWAGDEQVDGIKMGERFEGGLAAIIRTKDEKAAEQFVNELRRRLRREGKDKQLEVLNGVIKDVGKEYPEKIYAAEPVPE